MFPGAALADRPSRPIAAVAAAGCLALGLLLAGHHPLAPVLTVSLLVLWCIGVFLRPAVWLFVVPALLPIVDFAPWTGWLICEEFDILLLGAAAGAYASLAWRAHARSDAAIAAPEPPVVRISHVSAVLIGLFGVSTVLGLARGIGSVGTLEFGWFDGYYDAANSLRIAKGYVFALLMLPPLWVEMRRSEKRTLGALTSGLATGLGLASLAVLWERLAFPGLLNFSSDYRATALFWEMHVGGAALDGFLAMTFPFAIAEILSVPNRARWLWAGATALIAGYACLVTFSRGVYLAVPVSLAMLGMLLAMRRYSWSLPLAATALGKACLLALAMAVLSYVVFRTGGYRALAATLGVFAMTLPLGRAGRDAPASGWIAALGSGLLVGAAGSLVASLIPKGPYLLYGLAFVACAVVVWYRRQSSSLPSAIAGLAAYVWLVIAAAGVALGWGGNRALRDTAFALSILTALTIWNARSRTALWPGDLRMQCAAVGLAALAAVTTAVFSGGAYMVDRFASSESDAEGRLQHWRDGIGMLKTPADWLLGMGAGRFPPSFLFGVGDREFPGSSSIASQNGEHYLVLSGPRHESGFGEMFRVGQRVHVVPGGEYSIVFDARAPEAARLHLELCERHLIYVEGCAIAPVTVPAGGSWRRLVAHLDGANLADGPWYAPRLAFFAMATESPQTHVDIDNMSLIGPDGNDILVNTHFAQQMSHWFTTSDRYHLPWHIKNLGLNVLFDQGIVGLLLFVMLTGSAMYRLVAGAARGHPMAPFLVAALAGFLLVGLFDSLLDVPRLAFLFYLLTLVSFVLRPGSAAPSNRG